MLKFEECGLNLVPVDRLSFAGEERGREGAIITVLFHGPPDPTRVGATRPERDPAPNRVDVAILPPGRICQPDSHDAPRVALRHAILHR